MRGRGSDVKSRSKQPHDDFCGPVMISVSWAPYYMGPPGEVRAMAINFDWFWTPEPDRRSRVRQVYRDDTQIGRIRRWRGERLGEWFTAERKKGVFYEPIAGEHATFEEALERIVFYGVAH